MKRTSFIILLIITIMFFSFSRCNHERNSTQVPVQREVLTIHPVKQINIIGLVDLGEFDPHLIYLIKTEVASFYKMKVIELSHCELPNFAYNKSRDRYSADSLLVFLNKIKPNGIEYMVGLTSYDIYTQKDDNPCWGIFGLGEMPGKGCVISTLRLSLDAPTEELLENRFTKVVLHELGHNFGLDHCTTPICLMEDAGGTIKSVDREKKGLCVECRKNVLANDAPGISQ